MEDLDQRRVQPGAADQILRTLESFGFEWDGTVQFQNNRTFLYQAALTELQSAGCCYPCRCSRSRLARRPAEPGDEPVYPGICRADPEAGRGIHALRFRIDADVPVVAFEDELQGSIRQDCRREAGDFVIRRRDGYFAYQLAVVVDDELQGISEVVRGCDLLSSTPRQILLQRALGYRTPRYAHVPLLVEADGRKLAKSRRAAPIDAGCAAPMLTEALATLRQEPPPGLARATVREIWAWALANWQPGRLAGRRELRLPGPESRPGAD
jgi:glutamyl-Q tRNA(Asp) synthetase